MLFLNSIKKIYSHTILQTQQNLTSSGWEYYNDINVAYNSSVNEFTRIYTDSFHEKTKVQIDGKLDRMKIQNPWITDRLIKRCKLKSRLLKIKKGFIIL